MSGVTGMNEVFRALADPTRREILSRLKVRDMTAGELAELFPLAKSTLSGHFNVLKAADLVRTERRRQHIVYALNVSVVEEAMASLMALLHIGTAPGGTRP
jgi:DNA-binding transcriptional ArsR family regulator